MYLNNSSKNSASFTIIQSNQMEELLRYFVKELYANASIYHNIFDNFNVIVPSKVMGEWLKKQVADECGISTLVTTEFWGRYYWTLLQRVSRTYAYAYDYYSPNTKKILDVPEVAMLAKNVMQWRIFGYLLQYQTQILADTAHPLFMFIEPLINDEIENQTNPQDDISFLANDYLIDETNHQSIEQRFWQLAGEMASMLNRYMTYRESWLLRWSNNQAVPVKLLIADKDKLQSMLQKQPLDAVQTPDWLVEYYEKLEQAQRFLWFTLFKDDFNYRKQLREQFWQAFVDKDVRIAKMCQNQLPKRVVIFTIQQLPPSEFEDLQRLSEFVPVVLLHFNPSEQFWADIVDKNWLTQQQLIDPNTVYLKDYGHTLLSRFGKQSREVFAMLANLSGNEYEKVEWIDIFAPNPNDSLLANLQNDILMLDESDTKTKIQAMLKTDEQKRYQFAQHKTNKQNSKIYLPKAFDSSLAIHVCHSMVRQLEVLRGLLVGWLNHTDSPNSQEQRQLSDILVLVPDLEAQRNVIEAIFPKGIGADGFDLPAKITGVVAKEISELWQAITGYYTLLNQTGARFNRTAVFDWLMLPKLYESFGLNSEQMSRACELLTQAGFERGFDEQHLIQTLHEQDDDYRCTFAYALERLVAGFFMPNAKVVSFGNVVNQYGLVETIDPLPTVKISDKSIVMVLCQIYQTLHSKRYLVKISQSVDMWLAEIESLMQARFAIFNQSNAWLSIFSAQNDLKQHLEASHKAQTQQTETIQQLPLKLNFILQSIAQQIQKQQVSAEPTGMITFARIGAVRNLPYKLIVMLNLNLSDFPQQEPKNRYNLMQAGVTRRGDRFQEDDDLGAFLDAILCAKEACWLFYNGKSHTDTYEYLPASPVQELLDFLVENVVNDTGMDKKLYSYLVTEHLALPFDKQYFEIYQTDNPQTLQQQKSQLYPPAKMWFELYQSLYYGQKNQQNQKVNLWLKKDLTKWLKTWQKQQNLFNQHLDNSENIAIQHITLNSLLKSLQNPAKAFLDAQTLFVWQAQKQRADNELLSLDHLNKYQLTEQLVTAILKSDLSIEDDNLALYQQLQGLVQFNDMLPVGANRYHSFNQVVTQTKQKLQDFLEILQNLDEKKLQEQHSAINFSALLNFLKTHFQQQPPNVKMLLTDTQEQMFDIMAYQLADNGGLQQYMKFVIKTHLPKNLQSPYWIDYQVTSGREKYQLQFWLSHLCWQVARQTSEQQEKQQDGFSLWHYQKHTFYLPAITWQTAYQYLQNYLMLAQLTQKQLIILPPATTLNYIVCCQDANKNSTDCIKGWINSEFTQDLTVENFEFEQWQALIGDKKPSVILRFLQTLGEWAYLPLQQQLINIG